MSPEKEKKNRAGGYFLVLLGLVGIAISACLLYVGFLAGWLVAWYGLAIVSIGGIARGIYSIITGRD